MFRLVRISHLSFLVLWSIVLPMQNSDAFVPTPSHQQAPMTTAPCRNNNNNNCNTLTRRYFQDDATASSTSPDINISLAEQQRREWIDRSLQYYSKVMREERRRNLGQVNKNHDDPQYQQEYSLLAKKHYFALRKIKDGKPAHAEHIYRRVIGEIQQAAEQDNDEHCDHAQLAVTTLLLALHLQRTGAPAKQTRSVFLNFFRVVVVQGGEEQCACSAKVLQAFALFEMKQGNSLKSLQLVRKAIQLDPVLQPVLKWKQFREADARLRQEKAP